MVFGTSTKESNKEKPVDRNVLHQGSAGEEDGDEVVNQLGNTCAQKYFELEECLGEHNRDWSKCQREVKALQQCSTATKADETKQRILKAAKHFPSIKRDSIINDIKVEFRENKDIVDSQEQEEKVRIAQRSLEELESYVDMHPSSDAWTKTLKGSCE